MRFLCGNCKAKYQLPDEKVAGRTLRMNCRQCKSPIIIRGDGASMTLPPSGASIAAPAPLESMRASAPSAVGVPRASMGAPAPLGVPRVSVAMPAPLGVLRGSLAAPPPPPPLAAPPPLALPSLADAWHVGIHDVPVGPMSRDEVARKIALGAIGAESLAWCEGMGDWMPVRHIPELASLLGSRMPPPPEPPKAPPLPVHSGRRSGDPVTFATPAVGAAPMPAAWSVAPPEPRASQVFPTAPPAESQVPPAPVAQSWGRMFAMAGGLAFLMTATAIFGVKYLRSGETPPVAPAAVPATATATAAPAPAAPAVLAPPSRVSADLQLDVGGAEAVEPAVEPEASEAAAQRGKRAASGSATTGAKPGAPAKPLTAEQKEMLARMGGGLDSNPTLLNAPPAARGSTSSGGGTGSLTAAQLNQVRLRGQENLKRCYETALRSAGGSQETMRMDIEVTISPSGNVTEVKVSGNGLPGMDTCLTRTVRMWRFPSSGETTQTKFPVVFQPGG